MKRTLKLIVAIWSIFISVDEVVAFFSGPLSLGRFPFVAALLLVTGILLLVPKMEKNERIFMIIAFLFFGYFTVVGLIDFIRHFGSVEIRLLFSYILTTVKSIAFYLVPATLAALYLFNKKV